MGEYKNYRVNLKLKSTLITPFQADTIFGHICWAIRYLKGCQELEKFIVQYDNSNPPLLISDGFPKGYLPKPIIKPITQDELIKTMPIFKDSDVIKNSYKIKMIKKVKLIPAEIFVKLNQEPITAPLLFERLLERFDEMIREKSKREIVYHNKINRITNRVIDPYPQEEIFFNEEFNKFEIYIKTDYFSKEDLEGIFEFIGESGYGRDKSTGKGHFCCKVEDEEIKWANSPNAFMTLSSYIPDSKAPTKGYYEILLKYGKLGGDFAKSDPFKVPLIMFRSGSVFYGSGDKIYGYLLKNIHKNPDIRHYAYAFPIGINIEEEEYD